jgi:hypothetical protein
VPEDQFEAPLTGPETPSSSRVFDAAFPESIAMRDGTLAPSH